MIKPIFILPSSNTEELRKNVLSAMNRLVEGIDTSNDFGNDRLKNVGTPAANNDAATKKYVDDSVDSVVGKFAKGTFDDSPIFRKVTIRSNISGSTYPQLIFDHLASGKEKARIYVSADTNELDIAVNLYNTNSADWVLDNTAKSGVLLRLNPDTGPQSFWYTGTGTGTRLLTRLYGVENNGRFTVDGSLVANPVVSGGNIVAAGTYYKGTSAGVTGSLGVVIDVVGSFANIQYLDWGTAQQSITVMTGVTVTTSTITFGGGIRTA